MRGRVSRDEILTGVIKLHASIKTSSTIMLEAAEPFLSCVLWLVVSEAPVILNLRSSLSLWYYCFFLSGVINTANIIISVVCCISFFLNDDWQHIIIVWTHPVRLLTQSTLYILQAIASDVFFSGNLNRQYLWCYWSGFPW